MDFFAYQESAKRRSRVLIALYILAIIALVLMTNVVMSLAFFPSIIAGPALGVERLVAFWSERPDVVIYVSGMTLVLIGGTSLIKTAALRHGGGSGLAQTLGGRRVDLRTGDPREKVLINVVEEMAIAAGMPVPSVFVLQHEAGINAFAAGFSHQDMVIGLTRGAIDHLDRNELQGVVAHEFSHILHGDMKLNMQLMGTIYGISAISYFGRKMISLSRTGGRSRLISASRGRSRHGVSFPIFPLLGLALLVIGSVGHFFGMIIRAAVCRQREFLADAAAVQFTRNPAGISGALRKIHAHERTGVLASNEAPAVGHMLFASGLRWHLFGWFATHPKLSLRLQRLSGGSAMVKTPKQAASAGMTNGSPQPFSSMVGVISAESIQQAARDLQSMPQSLRKDVSDREVATLSVLAMLAIDVPTDELALVIDRQPIITSRSAKFVALIHQMKSLAPMQEFQLLSLMAPQLRALEQERGLQLLAAAKDLIYVDQVISPFEFSLFQYLHSLLRQPKAPLRAQRRSQWHDAIDVVGLMAYASKGDEAQRTAAFQDAMVRINSSLGSLPLPPYDLPRIHEALQRLAGGSMAFRRQVMEACSRVACFDGKVGRHELAMLHCLGEVFCLPLPREFDASSA